MCAGMGVDLVGKQLWQEEGLLRKEPHHLGTCSFDDELLLPREHRGVEERGHIWGSGGPECEPQVPAEQLADRVQRELQASRR